MNSNNAQYGGWGFQREDLGPGLITAGLSMLANNDGRLNTAQLIGQGGYDALAGLQWRKQYEAEMARQQMEDDRVQQAHDMQMAQSQMQMDEAARRAELERMAASGDDSAIKALAPLEWWKLQQAKAAADLQHQRDLEVAGIKAGAKSEPKLSDVTGTRSKFMSESDDYLAMGGSLKKILAGAKEGSGAGDLSVVFSYMKVLDPTSTVREGEFATAENSAGVPAKVTSIYNKLLNGERLTPKQRRDFVSMSKSLFKAVEPEQAERVRQYTNLANQFGVPVDMIVYAPYGDLMGQVDEYLNSVRVDPEVPPVVVPGVAASVPSHSNAPKVRIWNPQKEDFD